MTESSPFAVQESYGGPDGLKRLVEACHRAGMAVILDAIYNHFGPEGNVLPAFGDYLTEKYKTDWGPALNFDDKGSDAVRAMVLDNVRMWIGEYRLDGLRLDAADQIYDRSPRSILLEIAEVAHREGARSSGAPSTSSPRPTSTTPPGSSGPRPGEPTASTATGPTTSTTPSTSP